MKTTNDSGNENLSAECNANGRENTGQHQELYFFHQNRDISQKTSYTRLRLSHSNFIARR